MACLLDADNGNRSEDLSFCRYGDANGLRLLCEKKRATGIAPMAPSIIFQLFFYMFIQLSQALLASV
jgi:hypothetical protein